MTKPGINAKERRILRISQESVGIPILSIQSVKNFTLKMYVLPCLVLPSIQIKKGVDVMIRIFSDFREKCWQLSQKPTV
jgi:hypothetical protein